MALNTPVLWAKISVSPHDSLEKARRRLERSKSCPLDITVNFGPRIEYTGSVTEQIVRAMDLFRPVLSRTRSFNLSVPNRPQAHAALLRCREDAPLLETLTIQIHHSMQEDHYSTPPFPLFNGRTPRLVSCSLTSFNFGWDLRLMSRLRVLKLGGYFNAFTPSAKTLIDILRQCPELEELALRNMSDVDSSPCYFDDSDPPPGTKVIHLPRLTKASFYYAGIALTRQIMLQMSFPNLESLEMCYLENVTPVLQILYAQALTRLPLRFIRIESCLFSELKFLNLLRHLPSLVTLALVDVEDVSSHFLKVGSEWSCMALSDAFSTLLARDFPPLNLGFAPVWKRYLSMDARPLTGTPFVHSSKPASPLIPTPMRGITLPLRRSYRQLRPRQRTMLALKAAMPLVSIILAQSWALFVLRPSM